MKKSSFKSLIIASFVFLAVSPCFAAQNIISSVIISQSKEKPNAYELNIDSTSSTQYKTVVDEDGSVYFDLKNSTLAQNAGTIYDDAQNIDSVVVRQLDKNKVRIYVKGQYAKNTDVVFLNSLFENKDNSKKIVLNRPVAEYQPVNINADLENQEDIQDWDDNSFNFSHLISSILTGLKEGPAGIVLIILSIFALCAFIIKALAAKLSAETEPLIGLNQNRFQPNAKNFNQSIKREEAMKKAQEELSRAHQKYQDYLEKKYYNNVNLNQTPAAPKFNPQINQKQVTDAIRKGIALNQYQKSTQNPYLDQEVLRIKKDFEAKQENLTIPRKPIAKNTRPMQKETFTSPYIQRQKPVELNNIVAPKQNIKPTNLRFLESVSKIYEQSGRGDLANELKNSMLKVKQSI